MAIPAVGRIRDPPVMAATPAPATTEPVAHSSVPPAILVAAIQAVVPVPGPLPLVVAAARSSVLLAATPAEVIQAAAEVPVLVPLPLVAAAVASRAVELPAVAVEGAASPAAVRLVAEVEHPVVAPTAAVPGKDGPALGSKVPGAKVPSTRSALIPACNACED